jgi:hypothetical protein
MLRASPGAGLRWHGSRLILFDRTEREHASHFVLHALDGGRAIGLLATVGVVLCFPILHRPSCTELPSMEPGTKKTAEEPTGTRSFGLASEKKADVNQMTVMEVTSKVGGERDVCGYMPPRYEHISVYRLPMSVFQ